MVLNGPRGALGKRDLPHDPASPLQPLQRAADVGDEGQRIHRSWAAEGAEAWLAQRGPTEVWVALVAWLLIGIHMFKWSSEWQEGGLGEKGRGLGFSCTGPQHC